MMLKRVFQLITLTVLLSGNASATPLGLVLDPFPDVFTLGINVTYNPIDGLFEAVWVHRLHVSDAAVVERIGNQAGLDGSRLVAEAQTPVWKARLRAQTDDAISLGVFGVPSMVVGAEVFWGYDDLPYLELLLAGKDPIDPEEERKWRGSVRASAVRRQFRSRGEARLGGRLESRPPSSESEPSEVR